MKAPYKNPPKHVVVVLDDRKVMTPQDKVNVQKIKLVHSRTPHQVNNETFNYPKSQDELLSFD
jgi:hypothetical protein